MQQPTAGGNVFNAFSRTNSPQLQDDIAALENYRDVVSTGTADPDRLALPLRNASQAARDYVGALGDAEVNTEEYARSQRNLESASRRVMAAQYALNLAMSIGTMLLVSLAFKGIDAVVNRSKNLAEAFSTMKDEVRTLNDELDNHRKIIENTLSKYDEYARGVSLETNSNINLNEDQFADFLSIQEELSRVFPQLVTGWDAQGNAIVNLGNDSIEAAKKLNELLEVEKEINNIKIAANLPDAFKSAKDNAKNLTREKFVLQNEKGSIGNFVNQNMTDGMLNNQFTISSESLQKSVKALLDFDRDVFTCSQRFSLFTLNVEVVYSFHHSSCKNLPLPSEFCKKSVSSVPVVQDDKLKMKSSQTIDIESKKYDCFCFRRY